MLHRLLEVASVIHQLHDHLLSATRFHRLGELAERVGNNTRGLGQLPVICREDYFGLRAYNEVCVMFHYVGDNRDDGEWNDTRSAKERGRYEAGKWVGIQCMQDIVIDLPMKLQKDSKEGGENAPVKIYHSVGMESFRTLLRDLVRLAKEGHLGAPCLRYCIVDWLALRRVGLELFPEQQLKCLERYKARRRVGKPCH
jgi:hypothetical protein